MKIKQKTKKILVLSVMVVLLVATGVLNFVLNDTLSNDNQNQVVNATETFFEACRSERETTRESMFLMYDSILTSEASSSDAKSEAEEEKMNLIRRIDDELNLETLIKGKGFQDTIVTINDSGVNIVVSASELTQVDVAKVLEVVTNQTEFSPTQIKVMKCE